MTFIIPRVDSTNYRTQKIVDTSVRQPLDSQTVQALGGRPTFVGRKDTGKLVLIGLRVLLMLQAYERKNDGPDRR